MKKIVALLLALMMALSLAACGGDADETTAPKESEPSGMDMSKYPAKFEDWTVEHLNQYFTDAGVFTEADWVYVQPHAEYYPGTAVNDGGGYMDMDGLVSVFYFTFDPASQEADVPAYMEQIRQNKAFPEDMSGLPVDHMVGHVVFWYSATADETVYNAMDKAYNDLVAAMGLTPDF